MSQHASYERLQSLAKQIYEIDETKPKVALLLGTGLGALAERITVRERIKYNELNGMPIPTVESHAGEIVLGDLEDVPVIAFSGRLHAYEGHPMEDVVVPVRLAKFLGADYLIMGSIVGGLNPDYELGELVVLEDHINLMGVNPLVGHNDDRLGPRWPDMIEPYDGALIAEAETAASDLGLKIKRAVYAAVLGPNLETRAEYRMLRQIGGDVVGMSTVPEAIAAVHAGLKTLACSIVTDLCDPDTLEPANIERIIATAQSQEPYLANILSKVIKNIAAS